MVKPLTDFVILVIVVLVAALTLSLTSTLDIRTSNRNHNEYLLNGVLMNEQNVRAQLVNKSRNEDADGFIVFTNEDRIETFLIRNHTRPYLPAIRDPEFLRSLSGLAFDFKSQTFFYSEYDLGTINSVSYERNDANAQPNFNFKILAQNLKAVYALYYDPVENYLYMTNYYDSTISRLKPYSISNANSTIIPEIILKLSSNDKVRGIAVDPCDSRIYFANGNFHRPSIQRASMESGLNLETIIDTDIRYPRGLTLDHSTKELFWGDRDLNKIECTDFDGRNRIVIVKREANTDFFGIAVTNRFVYWTDFKLKTVFKAARWNNATGETSVVVAVKKDVQPRGILVFRRQIESRENCIIRPNLQNLNKNRTLKRIFGLGQQNQTLTCSYKSGPMTRSIWFHNGLIVQESGAVSQVKQFDTESDTMMTFGNISKSDEGNYSCLVSNGFVEETLNFTVETCSSCVPKLEKSQPERMLIKGQISQVLSCRYRSTSEANVTWTHNGEVLPETFPKFNGINGESVIRIANADWNASGTYSCKAYNEFGHDTFKFEVKVQEESVKEEVIYALTSAAVVILLLIFGLIFLWREYKANKEIIQKLTEGELKEFFEGNPEVTNSNPKNCGNLTALSLPFNPDLEISLENLIIGTGPNRILGQGQFGLVLRATLNSIPVAVKTLKPHSEIAYFKALLSELKIMAYIGNHKNIVQFLGAHTSQLKENVVHMVVELSPIGDLHSHLKQNRSNLESTNKLRGLTYENRKLEISETNLINWSMQIADGMNYLEQKKVIHGDLATRNVLLFHNDIVKISDFGLSRQLYQYTKYVKKSKSPLPFRWMALESLRFMEFTSQSDIWAYGVLLWEIFSLGQVPFPEVNWSDDFVTKLAHGLRLSRPDYAPSEIYQEMLNCWDPKPEQRPSFENLFTFFQKQLLIMELPIPAPRYANLEIAV